MDDMVLSEIDSLCNTTLLHGHAVMGERRGIMLCVADSAVVRIMLLLYQHSERQGKRGTTNAGRHDSRPRHRHVPSVLVIDVGAVIAGLTQGLAADRLAYCW